LLPIENPCFLLAHVKRKCKARRETEFFLENSVSVAHHS
jgi:hypothetical protein